jgi:hypothetical protein
MPVDLDAPNRAAMGAFGDQAQTGKKWTYTPTVGQAFDIDGVYDEAWNTLAIQSISRGGIAPVSTTKPALWVRIADLPIGFKPRQREALLRHSTGQNYAVADTQIDGMGGIRLILTKVG